ncbi:phosphatidylinositol-4-phosphate 5-kinase [Raphidocelis subcapitata]|uniref:Phosphatidylinositol-4-phosphate 5-kinase n=1 Tax=Raphidocelis subcapitata TaxID=307507 RepID=A0A2V0P4Z6_9CHLO|nr:phosphatidylinositol-4-phosphate 5-kinase [Raphidocelis subcapitata]|eukprot:GBF94649.1 phosphatidylinositol-4-phosphate 5-kinase [Raphidocelis subcapitata]
MSASSGSPGAAGAGDPASPYVSKTDLIDWVNGVLQLQLTKLEQFASGAVFCQLLDAYYSNAVNINKVNFFARDEHDSLPNYKLLQSGFTALNITRDISVQRLLRGSKVETLDLLQFLFRYLHRLQALEGYNARERRAMSLRGGTDAIPVPGWMAANFDNLNQGTTGGRSGFRTSSGNWAYAVEPQQSLRSQLRASGSFNPAASVAARPAPAASHPPAAAPAAAAPAAAAAAAARRPCAPVRLPTANPAAGRGAVGGGGAGGGGGGGGGGSKMPTHGDEDDERPGSVAVFRVVSSGEEAAALRTQAEDPACTTRLVVGDDAISGNMTRPLSPGGRGLLQSALDAASEAAAVLSKGAASCGGVVDTLGSGTNTLAYRGRVRSLQDACATLRGHAALLLSDVAGAVAGRGEAAALEVASKARALQAELAAAERELAAATRRLEARLHAAPTSQLNLAPTQLQRQLTSTAALDGAIRAVGTAQAAVAQRAHREGAAIAERFLADGGPAAAAAAADAAAAAAPAAAVPCKVLKMGDSAMKRLRNGDVYKGRYHGGRKNGEGCYCFTNADVYEGEFRDDRMAGAGVYCFHPEGRYEGEWAAATYEGAGSETFAKGSTYRGQYGGGLRSGWGVCRFYNGDYYEGRWERGVREGIGMQQCTDDSNYVGEYARGKRHGHGVYSFPNGDMYSGEYAEDLPQGYGVYVFASGQKYEGHWEHGKKHGWSIYTVETGQRWAGHWSDGKPVWVHPLPTAGEAAAPAGDAGGEGAVPDVAANLALATAACAAAQEAARIGQARAQDHWRPDGEAQAGLRGALQAAAKAADGAQAARARAQDLGRKLHAAALLVEAGGRSAEGIRLAAPGPGP